MEDSTIQDLIHKLIAFRDERDWQQFHNPKDLAAALSIEAAELQELFLWKQPGALDLDCPKQQERLAEEVADVAAYLLMLCHELKIDLPQALLSKLQKNAVKYPTDQVRGSAQKYSAYKAKD